MKNIFTFKVLVISITVGVLLAAFCIKSNAQCPPKGPGFGWQRMQTGVRIIYYFIDDVPNGFRTTEIDQIKAAFADWSSK